MKNRIKNNSVWYILTLIAFVSSVFLISEYNVNKNDYTINNEEFEIIQNEVSIDDEEFESKDFNMVKNISEAITSLLDL